PVAIPCADHRCFEHTLMSDQGGLDLGRRDVHAAHLHHIVAAAAIDVIAVVVREILVPSARPYAVEGGPAALAVVPVARRTGRAADQQVADLAAPCRLALLIDDRERIAGQGPAGRAV